MNNNNNNSNNIFSFFRLQVKGKVGVYKFLQLPYNPINFDVESIIHFNDECDDVVPQADMS